MTTTSARDRLRDRALERLRGLSGRDDARVWHVPGRIEVLGKHTDYAGGRSLLCTVERGIYVAASPREDHLVRAQDASGAPPVESHFETEKTARSGWVVYLDAVTSRLARNFGSALRGVDLVLESDLPEAAGVSSSSALVTGLFIALADRNALDQQPEYRANIHTKEDLAGYVSGLESGGAFGTLAGDAGVGTMSGSEDHTSILCCQPDRLSRYSFCPVRAEGTVPFPADCTFVIGVSGLVAVKTGDAQQLYNRAASASAAVLDVWHRHTGRHDPTLAAAATSSPDAADRIRDAIRAVTPTPPFTADDLLKRFNQFYQESEQIIPAAADAMARADLSTFGQLVDRSQRGVEDWLGNQVPETIFLARAARESGAMAASAFGAGFGGSVWALVRSADADSFTETWRRKYAAAFPHRAAASAFFATRPAEPLTRLV
ncbi:MAG: galactokinase [Acidobacteria bacterium]|nr:MAG: galactokinase [Acidobacteriota bacterium]